MPFKAHEQLDENDEFPFIYRIPVVTEKTVAVGTRRKRQDNPAEDDMFDFDFSDFDSKFDDIPPPSLDPDFEPSVDLPLGINVYSTKN